MEKGSIISFNSYKLSTSYGLGTLPHATKMVLDTINAPQCCGHYKEAVPGISWEVIVTEVGMGLD